MTNTKDRDSKILDMYLSKKYFTTQIAQTFGITTRTVQRVVSASGIHKTATERNREMSPIRNYSRNPLIPEKIREMQKTLPLYARQRIAVDPFCFVCRKPYRQHSRTNLFVAGYKDYKPHTVEENRADLIVGFCLQCAIDKF
jgi:hypothetical protein